MKWYLWRLFSWVVDEEREEETIRMTTHRQTGGAHEQ